MLSLTTLFGPIKAVIFDMDGTMIDNIPFHKKSWIQLLETFNMSIDQDTFDAQNHGTGPEMIRRLFGDHLTYDEAYSLWNEKERLYRELYAIHLYPIAGLLSFLKQLKDADIKIGLATMGSVENVEFVLDGLKLNHFFDVITHGGEVVKGKPHPEIYRYTLRKFGLPAYQCLAIEDSISGIRSASEAGIKTIAITTSTSKLHFNDLNVGAVIDNFDYLMV